MRREEHGVGFRRAALSRRQFVSGLGAGFGAVALQALLADERAVWGAPDDRVAGGGVNPLAYPLAAKPSMLPTPAKACIFLFMFGGPSQVDLFDYKPFLQQSDGKTIQNEFRRGALTTATLQASRRKFAQHGQSGQWCSDALPRLAQHVDKMAIIKSLTSDSFAHGSALLQINSGRILLDGADITSTPTHRRRIAMVFQDDQLFPHRRVVDNVAFAPQMAGLGRRERRMMASGLLDTVGVTGFDQRRVQELSGGEAKRVALARALAASPRVLLLDEPLSGLDPDLHDRLATEIAEILRTAGITAIWVTHDRVEARTVADRSIEMS